MSMLTGLYLSQHRIESVKANRALNKDIITLPAALNPQGYRTSAFSQNGLFSPEHNFNDFSKFYCREVLLDAKRKANKEQGTIKQIRDIIFRYGRKLKETRNTFDNVILWI